MTSPRINDVLQKTDWPLLREQKRALVEYVLDGKPMSMSHAEGVLNFIDAIQDAAVAMGVVEAKDVFYPGNGG